MNIKQLLGSISAMIVKVALAALVIVIVFRLAVSAYDFGYQVFVDLPMSEGEGKTVSVEVTQDQKVYDFAKMLEQKGLVRDANIFYVVLLLSNEDIKDILKFGKDMLKPGTYELSTAMNCEEMIEILCNTQKQQEEE